MWTFYGFWERKKAPDHTTLSRFRTGRCRDAVEDLFYQFVRRLEEQEETDRQAVFIDGTKLESRAGRYTFVWRKAVEKHLCKVKETVRQRTGMTSLAALHAHLEAQVAGITFVHGAGRRKSVEQREWEALETLSRR